MMNKKRRKSDYNETDGLMSASFWDSLAVWCWLLTAGQSPKDNDVAVLHQ